MPRCDSQDTPTDQLRRHRARPDPATAAVPSPVGSGKAPRRRALRLRPTTVAGLSLVEEVALLRAAIRRLARGDEAAVDVKTLAELRHQIDTLCTALKTQHALDGRDADAASTALARVLEELGDELGGPR